MNTIEIKGKEFTEDDIIQVLEMANELLEVNSELNARVIAMNAKLENEEKKVINLSQRLAQMSLMFTNKTYKA
jgi:glycine cleavage system H lipoate-binding protein